MYLSANNARRENHSLESQNVTPHDKAMMRFRGNDIARVTKGVSPGDGTSIEHYNRRSRRGTKSFTHSYSARSSEPPSCYASRSYAAFSTTVGVVSDMVFGRIGGNGSDRR